jgi:hypothetical protein
VISPLDGSTAVDDDYRLRAPATDPDEVRTWHEDNRASWNQGAARYTQGIDATVAFLREGGSLHPVERELPATCAPGAAPPSTCSAHRAATRSRSAPRASTASSASTSPT